MKKLGWMTSLVLSLSLLLAACGNDDKAADPSASPSASTAASPAASVSASPSASPAAQGPKTIKYLDKDYTLAGTQNIVVASLEAMEDAAVLGVKPVGAVTDGVSIPKYMAKAMEGAAEVGNRQQPNAEAILKLKADVILGTSKFQAAVAEQLNKVAPMIPVSHISSNWDKNLLMLGEITGKQDQAKQIIEKYNKDAAAAKEKIAANVKDKKVLIVRIRTGNMYLYPADVYLNPSLYTDLGVTVPEELKAVKAQDLVSLEKFAEINPDYVFLQFADAENKDQPKAVEELQNNPIFKSIKAAKNGKVFVNAIDPSAQGGTSWSKINFLDVAVSKLSQ
jgi:iron complex transport system substrate-binding protein